MSLEERDLQTETRLLAIALWHRIVGVFILGIGAIYLLVSVPVLGSILAAIGTIFAGTGLILSRFSGGGRIAALVLNGSCAVLFGVSGQGLALRSYPFRVDRELVLDSFILSSALVIHAGFIWGLAGKRAARVCRPSYARLFPEEAPGRRAILKSPFFWGPLALPILIAVYLRVIGLH